MAFPIDFPESNLTIHGPQGPQDPDVQTVRARRLDGAVVTCWQLTPEDIAEIIASEGKVWLSNWGQTMQPTLLSGRKADVI